MSKADEIWHDIKGFEGMYQISNMGRVRSLDRYVKNRMSEQNVKKGKILKSWILHGYELVALSKNSKNHYKRVHRLLAEAFIPKENKEYNIVNHKDGNKANNKIENLEWCTQKQNVEHAIKNNLFNNNQNKNKKVIQFDKEGNFIKEWKSIAEAGRKLGYKHSRISECCKGKIKTSHGYIWRYKEE